MSQRKENRNYSIADGNRALRKGDYVEAIRAYTAALAADAAVTEQIEFNLSVARRKYRRFRRGSPLRVAVCGWDLSHNAAGRVRTLTDLWSGFADTEIIGATFLNGGHDLWPPIRNMETPCHSIRIENDANFPGRAFELVRQHPYDVVHLSKPRFPNIIFGLLYKLIWDAQVIMDVDDEELGAVGADRTLEFDAVLEKNGESDIWKSFGGRTWTQVSVGLWDCFDSVTTSNEALCKRYGGVVVPHARDAEVFTPSPKRQAANRARFNIPEDKIVVLFFGTPRRHKGLVETAQALAALGRDDICFTIVGDFPDGELRRELEAVEGVEIHFVGAQPYEDIHNVVAIGDICVLLQDDGSLLGKYQTPAKLTDALGMGLLVFAEVMPGLASLAESGGIVPVTRDTLCEKLGTYLADRDLREAATRAGYELFLKELSLKAGRERIRDLVPGPAPLGAILPARLFAADRNERIFQALGRGPGLSGLQVSLKDGSAGQGHNNERTSREVGNIGLVPPRDTHDLASLFSESVRKSVFFSTLQSVVAENRLKQLFNKLSVGEPRLEDAARRMLERADVPLVSVIMPTFNRAETIQTAIRSVKEQSYAHWELLVCDDASTDATEQVVTGFGEERIRYLKLQKGGAAAARNAGLRVARGEIITYLDSDNLWHPHYLARVVKAFADHPGKSACYSDDIDYRVARDGSVTVKSIERPSFDQERLLEKNFIDLNSFGHRRELYDLFGGFTEGLKRRQDYDLIIKYTWIRDPIKINEITALYQRNDNLNQITTAMKDDQSCVQIIQDNIETYLESGLPCKPVEGVQRVTVVSWDLCRNHFAKPFAVAEALSSLYDVKLVSFRFFEEEIFPPLEGVDPPFETAYFQGAQFPEFFDSLRNAVDEIDGDIIYVVKPKMPSLAVALFANALRGAPIVLEINDLETVVGSPKENDSHEEAVLDPEIFDSDELKNPYSDLWSRIMDPISKRMPVLLTHNKELDRHFDGRCLYMRNLKDESVYDPRAYDRDEVRRELGFQKSDRVILFGGLLRKHKGIYELVELIERLEDPAYKLLFVGSRVTPDQEKMVAKFGDQIRVLPPQDRESMARINLAADLVLLWLNPEVAASHYQMPYKATDAFAMETPIVANDISDLGALHRQGYLAMAPFGDWDAATAAIRELFDRPQDTRWMQARARRLFRRQFSYAAGRSCFALAAQRAIGRPRGQLEAAREFTERFNSFYQARTGTEDDFVTLCARDNSEATAAGDDQETPIRVLDVARLGDFWLSDPSGVAVVMPSIDIGKARSTADVLLKRAGMTMTVIVAEDTTRQGFIATLNDVAVRLDVKYIVYLAEDAFPGIDWLKIAYDRLEQSGKGLLAFNCGKWRGRIAAFGMIRTSWVKSLYDESVLYPGYKAHKADNEITVIARLSNEFIYEPDATLVEIDPYKSGVNNETAPTAAFDRRLFTERFRSAFNGTFSADEVAELEDEYLRRRKTEDK